MKYLLLLSLMVISFFAFSPGQFTPAFIVNHDKAAHTATFFVLSLMLRRSFSAMSMQRIIILLGMLALAIETIQLLFANRGFSAEDMIFNVFGISIYVILEQCLKLIGSLVHSIKKR